jgi:DUF1016 N-terminal domain
MTNEAMGISQTQYKSVLKDIINIYEQSMNDGNEDWNKAILTSNWGIGKRIIKIKQMNSERAAYGDHVIKQLSKDLNKKYSKGFSERNLGYIRKFYLYQFSERIADFTSLHNQTWLADIELNRSTNSIIKFLWRFCSVI